MHVPSPGRLLDAAIAALGLNPGEPPQLYAADRLLARAAWPDGMPAPATAAVPAWREAQGIGSYIPPVAPFPLHPGQPALIWGAGRLDLPALATLLAWRYPSDHELGLLALDADLGLVGQEATSLDALPVQSIVSNWTMLFVPALAPAADRRGLEGLRWVVARLLGPGGCPWDIRQTHQSLRGALLEEAHEALEALDAGDMPALSEELGDLLISVLAHSEMARQSGHFSLEALLDQVTAKLIRRHPHVFADLVVGGEGEVLGNWERIKAGELAAKGRVRESALDGVPPSLPALATAQKLGKKAARTGFTWPTIDHVWAKLREELDELAEAAAQGDAAHTTEELGDTLFVLAILAGWLDVDAESALRETNAKFRRRFSYVEQRAAAQGRTLADLGLEALLALWHEAKTASSS